MKVAIINTPRKGVEVHGAGCADVAKSEKRNRDEAWIIDVDSRVELSHTYWGDIISDTVSDIDSAEGWATAIEYMGEFNFLPCCKALPLGQSPHDEAPAPAPAAELTSVWVGYRVANKIMFTRPGTIATKLENAKPTKCADRTVRLDTLEVLELREYCTELEGEGGMTAYSARSLRKRLA